MDIPASSQHASGAPSSSSAGGPSAVSPSTSPSASHLAQRLENLAFNARPDASPLRKEQDRQDAQRRVENLERLGDSHTGAWEKGRSGVAQESSPLAAAAAPAAASSSELPPSLSQALPSSPCSVTSGAAHSG